MSKRLGVTVVASVQHMPYDKANESNGGARSMLVGSGVAKGMDSFKPTINYHHLTIISITGTTIVD